MGAGYHLHLVYGFPVTHTKLEVPTRLGQTAPSLFDWFEVWRRDHPDSMLCCQHFGWMSKDPVPFIGVPVASERNIGEAEVPGARIGAHADWIKVPEDEKPFLESLRTTLGCDEPIGFYMMLQVG